MCDDLGALKAIAHLRTEKSGISQTDCRTLSTFPSVLDDLGCPDLSLSIVESVFSNLRTYFMMRVTLDEPLVRCIYPMSQSNCNFPLGHPVYQNS